MSINYRNNKFKILFRIPFTYYFLIKEKPSWSIKYFFNIATKEFDFYTGIYYYKTINDIVGLDINSWYIKGGKR